MEAPVIPAPLEGMQLTALRLAYLADTLTDKPQLASAYRASASAVRDHVEAQARKARRRHVIRQFRRDLVVVAVFAYLALIVLGVSSI